MRQEKNYLLSIGENYSHGLLDVPENEFACVKIHALIVKESIVGFCLIPSYDETLLMRLYTVPKDVWGMLLLFLSFKNSPLELRNQQQTGFRSLLKNVVLRSLNKVNTA